jgi:hypothetical protein
MCVYTAPLYHWHVHTCWIEHSDIVRVSGPMRNRPIFDAKSLGRTAASICLGHKRASQQWIRDAVVEQSYHSAVTYIIFEVWTHELIPDAWVFYVKTPRHHCSLFQWNTYIVSPRCTLTGGVHFEMCRCLFKVLSRCSEVHSYRYISCISAHCIWSFG